MEDGGNGDEEKGMRGGGERKCKGTNRRRATQIQMMREVRVDAA